ATRSSGSMRISSSFASPITAAPWRATIGRMASSRSSSPVTELTSAFPSYAARPASSASITEESMQSGSSVSPCTRGITCAISPTSSAIGSPTLTSSTSALSTCSATSISTCERSPACSCAWNALRPVGLIRSPLIVNGPSALMTTALDRDSRTVSTRLPFCSCGDAKTLTKARDARLAAEADQVQPANARQRPRVLGELAAEREALRFGIGRLLAVLDELLRHLDARDLVVDETERTGRSNEADRRQDRRALGKPLRDGHGHEPLEHVGVETQLELEEAGSRLHLLQRALDAVLVGRRTRVLDRADEEVRRGVDRASGQVVPRRQRPRRRDELRTVEVEHAPRRGLVAGGH